MIKKLFKRYFAAGLLVFVPLMLTITILQGIIKYADGILINILPDAVLPENLFGFHIPGLGLVATVIFILFAGFLTRVYIGKRVILWGEQLMEKIPVGRSIYSGIKQFMQTFFSDNSQFKGVALVEFPRRDCWTIGFITGEAVPELQALSAQQKWVSVFVPTAPSPVNGFLIMLPESDIKTINMTIDHAFKLILSGGIVQKPAATPPKP